jgi:hypothetical protein
MQVATDFIRSPLGIAVLMIASSIGGGWIKDRVSSETRDSATVARIDAIDRRLDDIRQDLRDMKMQIADSTRALANGETGRR